VRTPTRAGRYRGACVGCCFEGLDVAAAIDGDAVEPVSVTCLARIGGRSGSHSGLPGGEGSTIIGNINCVGGDAGAGPRDSGVWGLRGQRAHGAYRRSSVDSIESGLGGDGSVRVETTAPWLVICVPVVIPDFGIMLNRTAPWPSTPSASGGRKPTVGSICGSPVVGSMVVKVHFISPVSEFKRPWTRSDMLELIGCVTV
jgi:hypothetical protein